MFQLSYGDKGLTSLKQNDSTVEFIQPGEEFGAVKLCIKKGEMLYHESPDQYSPAILDQNNDRAYVLPVAGNGATVTYGFARCENRLVYTIQIDAREDIEILDLAIPMPMNSQVSWGEDAGAKVIRHSAICGDGSFVFWTRMNNKPDYLLMLPECGLSYFDHVRMSETAFCYQAYIHAVAANQKATEKGCQWRQAVSARSVKKGESAQYKMVFTFEKSYEDIRKSLVLNGKPNILVLPGFTVPTDLDADIYIQATGEVVLEAEFSDKTTIQSKGGSIFTVRFTKLGENMIYVKNGEKTTVLEFFVTEPIETLIDKRAAFIQKRQITDSTKWYDGLFAEWNMETQTLLSPDNYDQIKGWRIYEVTCDDPGLSKPSFISSKNVIRPKQAEVTALDDYIEKFVWGGLQNKTDSEYPYAIYGIPDWYQNRNAKDEGIRGQLHIWRVYDYPHIFLLYYNMYQIAKHYPPIQTRLSAAEYLERAYRTAIALFTIPAEVVDWSAFETGFYNERVITDMLAALEKEGWQQQARRLRNLWERKAYHFIVKSSDVFGSEYPFDTTGFESTYSLAKYALDNGVEQKEKLDDDMFRKKALHFMHEQATCNIACRGYVEPTYYLYGSDYRGDSSHYTLSYMAQMGGGALLSYALLYAGSPYEILRLAYGSLLSSWALMNTGTEESQYGYWFSGKENDGGCGGGFEPSPFGMTWMEQPHHRGSWYYSCEMDLGYTGYLRDSAVVLVNDPVFGMYSLGGTIQENSSSYTLTLKDGVYRRVAVVMDATIMLELCGGAWEKTVTVSRDGKQIMLNVENATDETVLKINGFAGDLTITSDSGTKRVTRSERTIETAVSVGNGRYTITVQE